MTDTANDIGPTLLTDSAVTVYTAPAGGAILRCLNFCNESTATTITLSIGTAGTGKYVFKATAIGANSVVEWTGFLFIPGGTIVQALAGTTNFVSLTGGVVEQS
jgi:Ca2+-binding RTX toxin-like protein